MKIPFNRITPENITELAPNEIFVFGSNLSTNPKRVAGAASSARFFGSGVCHALGFEGQTYALPTKDQMLQTLPKRLVFLFVSDFVRTAAAFPEKTFLVTAIGCGLAGYTAADIAPMFRGAIALSNVKLPISFWNVLLPTSGIDD